MQEDFLCRGTSFLTRLWDAGPTPQRPAEQSATAAANAPAFRDLSPDFRSRAHTDGMNWHNLTSEIALLDHMIEACMETLAASPLASAT